MNKINNIPEQIASIRQRVTTGNVQNTGDAFSKTLKEAISGVQTPELTQAEYQPGIVKTSAMNPAFMKLIGTSEISEVMNQTDMLLSRLDNYAKLLEDPSNTLKEMEPVIDSIKKDADALNADAEKKLPEGSGIKKIVKEFAIAANAEYMRFKRGDYA